MSVVLTQQNSIENKNLAQPYRPRAIAIANALATRISQKKARERSLDPERLVADARHKTGLERFDDDNFLEPLSALCASIEEEARLNPVGRVIMRGRLVGLLCNKLRLQAAFETYPEIADEPIKAPLVIAGLQRTGTTMLHRLIAADSQIRSLASWEAVSPVPSSGKHSSWDRGSSKLQAKFAERALAYMSPGFFAIHPVEASAPEEEIILMDHSFLTTSAEATLCVPSYAAWLETQDQKPAYECLKRMLQYLQWQRPASRWVLKTPHHLEWLDVLLGVFPDAKVIQTHRDPRKTTASFCSMVAHARGVFSDEVDPHEVGRHWMKKIERMVGNAMRVRAQRQSESFIDVQYADLMRDPLTEVARIYAFAELKFDDAVREQLEATRQENRQHKYGRHRYRLEDFALSAQSVEQALGAYIREYKIPNET